MTKLSAAVPQKPNKDILSLAVGKSFESIRHEFSPQEIAGNVVYSKIAKCTSNLPLVFTLKAPLFVGYEPVEIAVNIEVNPENGSLILNLISQDYIDLVRDATNSAFDEIATELNYIPLVYS